MAKEKNVKRVTRGMPNNIEAEASVLGSILIDNVVADAVIPKLKVSDFYDYKNRLIFEAMKDLQTANKSVDTVTVSDALELKGQLDEAGSIGYLSELADAVPSAANCDYYVDIVKRDSLLRRIIQAGNDIVKNAYESTDAAASLINAEKQVFEVSEQETERDLVKASTAFSSVLGEINLAQTGRQSTNVLKTGFKCFDRKTRGLRPGALIILAARPSVGKTALALNIAANVALDTAKNKSVALFSLEMSANELAKRMLAYISGVSLTKMDMQGGLRDADFKKISGAYLALINSNLYIDDYSMNGPSDVLSKCRRLKREKGLDLIIIDYLQLMTNTDERSVASRQEEVSKMSRQMKIYARELGCPILILSQMSRGIEQRNDHKPLLSDLRESGSIEQDADIVTFLYNPSKYNAALPANQVILNVQKNRSGATGDIMLEWTGETTTFKEMGDYDGTNITPYEPYSNEKKQEQSVAEKIQSGAEFETALQDVGANSLPFGDNALPFGENIAAADNLVSGTGNENFDENLKKILSTPTPADDYYNHLDEDEYEYSDNDAPPEDGDIPF